MVLKSDTIFNNPKKYRFDLSNPEGDFPSQSLLDKPVVILQHGLLDSFLAFLLNGKDSIAFRLADAGYDVWLNNSRGN